MGGAAQDSADCRKNCPRSSRKGTHPTTAECAAAARVAWGGGRYRAARVAMREQGRSKTGIASLPHVKLAPMSALGQQANDRNIWTPSSPLQEPDRGGACFEDLTFLQLRGMQIPPHHAAHALEEGKDPTSKQFDDDEWTCSLTEAQEVTAEVPEHSVMYDQARGRPEKSSAHSNGGVLAERCLTTTSGAQRRRNRSPHDSDAAARSWIPRRC